MWNLQVSLLVLDKQGNILQMESLDLRMVNLYLDKECHHKEQILSRTRKFDMVLVSTRLGQHTIGQDGCILQTQLGKT